MNFKPYDLVKIVKKPTGAGAQLFEKVCIVILPSQDTVYLVALKLDGTSDGLASVTPDHLEFFTPDDAWSKARDIYKNTINGLAKDFQVGYNKKLKELGQRYGLDSLDVEDIYAEINEYVIKFTTGKPLTPTDDSDILGSLFPSTSVKTKLN